MVAGEVGDVLREPLGVIEIAGSVAQNLMVWGDIDPYEFALARAGDTLEDYERFRG